MAFVDHVGADRVLFGSDAVADGPSHYLRDPPNVEGRETYNGGLISLVRALGPADARKIMSDNTRRVFALEDSVAVNVLPQARSRRAG
jgi:predicted TIM-barrel fold metal-dependent hydrolase